MLGFWNKSVYITYLGAFVSILGLLLAFNYNNYDYAFVGMIIAAVCDMFDGKVARHLKRTEQEKSFGVEIDSLADIVAFITVPALTLYLSGLREVYQLVFLALYVVSGIIRLGYFNVAMSDKDKYFISCREKKEKLVKKLEKIDIALSDTSVLEKEFKRYNAKVAEEKRIKSIITYKKRIITERERLFAQINEITYILISSNYQKKKNVLKENLEPYKTKDDVLTTLIELQKEFLLFVEKRLSKMKTRDEIIDLLYELRYYRQLRIDKNYIVCEIEDLEKLIDRIMKSAITALCKMGAMKIISMDINLNFEIIKYALTTKIIELENIRISIDIEDDSIIIRVFDKDVIEKQGRKQLEISKETFEIKSKRKIKLFN